MTTLTRDLKPGTGLILVELPLFNTTVTTKSGINFTFDPSFESDRHQTVSGTVIAMADVIKVWEIVREGDKKITRRQKTIPNELQIGDKVWFDNQSVLVAKKWEKWGGYWERAEMGGIKERLLLIPYDQLICAKRGEELISVNNHVIASKIRITHDTEKVDKISGTAVSYIPLEGSELVAPGANFKELKVTKTPYQLEYERIKNDSRISNKNKDALLRWVEKTYINNPDLDTARVSGMVANSYEKNRAIILCAPPDSGIKSGDRFVYDDESDIPVEHSYQKELPEDAIYMKLDDVLCLDSEAGPVAYANKVVIEPAEEESTAGSFYIPEAHRKKVWKGIIVSAGPNVKEVEVGDEVMFNPIGATRMEDGEYMVRETEVFGKYAY